MRWLNYIIILVSLIVCHYSFCLLLCLFESHLWDIIPITTVPVLGSVERQARSSWCLVRTWCISATGCAVGLVGVKRVLDCAVGLVGMKRMLGCAVGLMRMKRMLGCAVGLVGMKGCWIVQWDWWDERMLGCAVGLVGMKKMLGCWLLCSLTQHLSPGYIKPFMELWALLLQLFFILAQGKYPAAMISTSTWLEFVKDTSVSSIQEWGKCIKNQESPYTFFGFPGHICKPWPSWLHKQIYTEM